MALNPAYQKALDEIREATAKYTVVRDAYRAGKISDAEYLAARKVWKDAEAAFDVAYAADGRS